MERKEGKEDKEDISEELPKDYEKATATQTEESELKEDCTDSKSTKQESETQTLKSTFKNYCPRATQTDESEFKEYCDSKSTKQDVATQTEKSVFQGPELLKLLKLLKLDATQTVESEFEDTNPDLQIMNEVDASVGENSAEPVPLVDSKDSTVEQNSPVPLPVADSKDSTFEEKSSVPTPVVQAQQIQPAVNSQVAASSSSGAEAKTGDEAHQKAESGKKSAKKSKGKKKKRSGAGCNTFPQRRARPPILFQASDAPSEIDPEGLRPREFVSSVLSDEGYPRMPVWEALGRPRPPSWLPRRRSLPPLEILLPPPPQADPEDHYSTVYGPTFRARAPHIVYEDDPLPNTSMVLHNETAGTVDCDCSPMTIVVDGVPLPVIMINPACEVLDHLPYNRLYAASAENPDLAFRMRNGRMVCMPGNDAEEELPQAPPNQSHPQTRQPVMPEPQIQPNEPMRDPYGLLSGFQEQSNFHVKTYAQAVKRMPQASQNYQSTSTGYCQPVQGDPYLHQQAHPGYSQNVAASGPATGVVAYPAGDRYINEHGQELFMPAHSFNQQAPPAEHGQGHTYDDEYYGDQPYDDEDYPEQDNTYDDEYYPELDHPSDDITEPTCIEGERPIERESMDPCAPDFVPRSQQVTPSEAPTPSEESAQPAAQGAEGQRSTEEHVTEEDNQEVKKKKRRNRKKRSHK